jgi:hypothetical protein
MDYKGSVILLIHIIHKLGASMVKRHIARYLSIYSPKTFCLNVHSYEYLKIHRIQDVFFASANPLGRRTMACSKLNL